MAEQSDAVATAGVDTISDTASIQAVCSDPNFRITTSLRWSFSKSHTGNNPKNDCLEYHQRRLLASATKFGLEAVVELLSDSSGQAVLLDAINKHSTTVAVAAHMWKLTLSVSANGKISIASMPLSGPLYDFLLPDPETASLLGPDAKVHLSNAPTAISVFTLHKTNHRPMYTSARLDAGIEHEPPTTAEVLLHNDRHEITEASLSTVYFLRGGRWITPASSCGGNLGSTRSLALTKYWCKEGIILRQDVVDLETVVLSNGARGFWQARVFVSQTTHATQRTP